MSIVNKSEVRRTIPTAIKPRFDRLYVAQYAKPRTAQLNTLVEAEAKRRSDVLPISDKPAQKKPAEIIGIDGFALSSGGNAERFLNDHGKRVLWIQGNGINGGTFLVANAQNLWTEQGSVVIKTWMRQSIAHLRIGHKPFFKQSDSNRAINDALGLVAARVQIAPEQFDADPLLLSVKNGVIDLNTCQFRERQLSDLLTKVANVEYNPEADCPRWESFINDCTNRDADFARYLQQLAGITLSGQSQERLFLMMWGPTGSGKTVFGETLYKLMGTYSQQISPETLAASKNNQGGRPRPDLAKLAGARLVFANEGDAGLYLDGGIAKSLTGNDTFPARFLYKNEFEYIPQFKLWFRTNHKPRFDGADEAIVTRIRLLPFEHQVPADKQDTKLKEKLATELSGILNWALAGWVAYKEHGLQTPDVVKRMTAEYAASQDAIQQYLDERCERIPGAMTRARQLHNDYKVWVQERGENPLSETRFKEALATKRLISDEDRTGRFWRDLQLKPRTM